MQKSVHISIGGGGVLESQNPKCQELFQNFNFHGNDVINYFSCKSGRDLTGNNSIFRQTKKFYVSFDH